MLARLAIIGVIHETNTFSPLATGIDAFASHWLLEGHEIADLLGGSDTAIAGLLGAGSLDDVVITPLVVAWAQPSGVVARDALDEIIDRVRRSLGSGGRWDGVLLALHGAMVAEDDADADALVLEAVRGAVGSAAVIGVTLDMHANVSDRMVEAADVIVAFQTNPHLDARTRAERCAHLVLSALRGETRPTIGLVRLPMAIPILAQDTSAFPLADVLRTASRIAHSPGMLDVSVLLGFPYADVPAMGASIVAIADSDRATARRAAQVVAQELWHARSHLSSMPTAIDDALARASAGPRPSVILDIGDNIGGGAPGDSVAVLQRARQLGIGGILQTVWDPVAVEACHAVMDGGDVSLVIGGRSGASGTGVEIHGTLRCRSAGRFRSHRAVHGGLVSFDQGETVVIDFEAGNTVVITARRVGNVAVEQFTALGIDPAAYDIIVAKGVYSIRPTFEHISGSFVPADTPGPTFAVLTDGLYRRRPRPMFPFEAVDAPAILPQP